VAARSHGAALAAALAECVPESGTGAAGTSKKNAGMVSQKSARWNKADVGTQDRDKTADAAQIPPERNRWMTTEQTAHAAADERTGTLRAALGPFPISGDPAKNLRAIRGLVKKAAAAKCDLIAFAEGAVSGYYGEHFSEAAGVDFAAVERAHVEIGAMAQAAGITILAGTLIREEGRYLNALAAWGPDGALVATYIKRHGTRRDERFYTNGTEPVIIDVRGRKVGLLICFDVRFPLWTHEYARRGAEVLVFTFNACDERSVWKRDVMEACLRARAAEANAFVLGVNDARPYPNVPCLAVDRGGCTIARRFPRRAELIVAELDFSKHYAIEREIVAGHSMDYAIAAGWVQDPKPAAIAAAAEPAKKNSCP
jgi:predicted amidohydrolase